MTQLEGFIDSTNPNYVDNLKILIYSLKQTTRVWFERSTHYLRPHSDFDRL